MSSYTVFAKVLPILLLFLVGYLFRRTGFLSRETTVQLKSLVANVTLPALLFRAFLSMEFSGEKLSLALMMFALCGVILLGTWVILRLLRKKNIIDLYMIAGFEAGMLGYALFLAVFGDEALPVFASVDLGQVLFVFIVLMPLLISRSRRSESEASAEQGVLGEALGIIVRSPVIWAIFGGLVLGALGRSFSIPAEPLAPISGFLRILGDLTAPLIAIAIGYELSFNRSVLGPAALFVLIRKAVLIGFAFLLLQFLPVKDELTAYAFVTMLLLPPPFVVTLAAKDEEQSRVSGILSLSTVISIPAFAVAMMVMTA